MKKMGLSHWCPRRHFGVTPQDAHGVILASFLKSMLSRVCQKNRNQNPSITKGDIPNNVNQGQNHV